MRAYATDRFGDLADLTLRDLPKPAPGPSELLIQIKAAAINPADLMVLTNTSGGSFLHAGKFPLTLGFDFCGTVAEKGSSAGKYRVGDEVFGFLPYARSTRGGTFAEYVAVASGTVGPKPKSLSPEQAAASATVAVTALQALRDKGRLGGGQSVLINGASGGVGTIAIQVARALGATVTAVCSAAKAPEVKSLRADAVYDYRTTRLTQITERFDVVLDAACTSSFRECAALLNPGGTYVVLLPSLGLITGMVHSLFSSKRCRFLGVAPVAGDLELLSAWFDEGKLKPILDASYPLAEVPKALARVQAGDIRGKVAISI